MPRSVFQLIVLPYFANRSASTGRRIFFTSSTAAKSAQELEGGSSYSAQPLPWSSAGSDLSANILRFPALPRSHDAEPPTILAPPRQKLDPPTPTPSKSPRHEPGPSTSPANSPRPAPNHPTPVTLYSSPTLHEKFRNSQPNNTGFTAKSTEESHETAPKTPTTPFDHATKIKRTHPGASPRFHNGPPSHARIAALAFQKIVDAHTPKPDRTRHRIPFCPTSSTNPLQVPALGLRAAFRLAHPPPPSFPPAIHRLLSNRLFRMAVFHFLHTPEYASDTELMERIARRLDSEGAARLAHRLRSGWDLPRFDWPAGTHSENGQATLWTDPDPDSLRKPPSCFVYTPAPPPQPTFTSNYLTRQAQLQNHFNAQLNYLLTRPSHPFSISPLGLTPPPPGPHFPPPEPSLHRLGRLLALIDGLERNRAFVPDRITANIIVRCWIRCGLGIYNPTGPGAVPRYHRVPSLKGGKWAWKKPTIAAFGPAELRSVFEVTSSAMKRHATLGEAWDGDKLEYERHIRPFCKMIIRAAKVLGDYEVYGRAVRMRIEGKAFGVRGVWTRYEEIVRTGGQLGRSDEDEREDEDEGGDGDGDEEQLGRRAAGRA